MARAIRWGISCAVVGAVIGASLSVVDHLLSWPLTNLTPEGVMYLAGSIAVPAAVLFAAGFCAGLGAEKFGSAPSRQ